LTFLLDTNIVIGVLNQEPAIEHQLVGKTILLASIVLGELYYGAYKSARFQTNLAKIEAFAVNYPIVDCTKQTAEQYGRLKQSLEASGGLIPENDIWIAALATQHHLTLVTRDEHFKRVAELLITQW
jgi:tRNA(fMet)-specific endonuclease VapC